MPRLRGALARYWAACVAVVVVLCAASGARAGETQIAVAANFSGPMQALAQGFEQKTKHHAVLVSGATGKLAAQIQNGAPFEILLAADVATPQKLEEQGLVVPGSRFTYALGRLALYGNVPGLAGAGEKTLRDGAFLHLALANPKLAPYGAAALSVLEKLGLRSALEPKFVFGENISQTFEFVATGNADLGFVALSQLKMPGKTPPGSYWIVPNTLCEPIRQDAALLTAGAKNPAARALLDYLRSDAAKAVIRSYGYEIAAQPAARADSAASKQ